VRCDFGRSSVSFADNFNSRDRRRERLGVKGSRYARDVSLAHRFISSRIFHNRRIFFFVIAYPRLCSRGLVLAARKRSAARMSANARRRRVSLATRGERDFENPVPGCSDCSQPPDIVHTSRAIRSITTNDLESNNTVSIHTSRIGRSSRREKSRWIPRPISAHRGRCLEVVCIFYPQNPQDSRISPSFFFLFFFTHFLAHLLICGRDKSWSQISNLHY